MFNTVSEKITPEQELIIRRNINPTLFDVEGIINYLKENDIVEFDVFKKFCKKKVGYSFLRCFKPISRAVFIWRLEIYFYDLADTDSENTMTSYFADYIYETYMDSGNEMLYEDEVVFKPEFNLEPAYQLLDKIICTYKIPLNKVFNYLKDYFGQEFGYRRVAQWVSYLELLEEPNENNVFPTNFYYSLNKLMEEKGQSCRFVSVNSFSNKPRFDTETKCQYFTVSGYFPKDEEGNIVPKWIGMWAENVEEIKIVDEGNVTVDDEEDFFFMHNFSGSGYITLELKVNPNSRVFVLKRKKGTDGVFHNFWKQIYAGPCVSKFSFKPIIEAREKMKLSQKEVADLADINLRSYQRMEAGESTPDGLALISLMSLLDITSLNTFRKKPEFVDDGYAKFNSGKPASEFLDEKDR